MKFITDKQTLDDLNLTGKFKPNSVFSLFNKVKTIGGERLLEMYFKEPLTDPAAINARSGMFRYFRDRQLRFDFTGLTEALQYISLPGPAALPLATTALMKKKLFKALLHDEEYDRGEAGLRATVGVLKAIKSFLPQLVDYPMPEQLVGIQALLTDSRLQWLDEPLPAQFSSRHHHLVQGVFREQLEGLEELLSYWDVMVAVAGVAQDRGLHFAKALPAAAHVFRSAGVRHPALNKGVANPLDFSEQQNLLFLTGANMAGKSTLMKSFGIAVYLAHMGFPVAAAELEFSVMDGLYTSINVADNLNQGYSHYYAEVLRVKKVAEDVSAGHNLVVIFDELFKGTNVKDAYDATLEVTKALADYRNCFFIISTHIIEVADALPASISFAYLPTVMNGAVPEYTYQLTAGVTNDRQGMMIIKNEGILDILLEE
jgi:DNA mismatch repair ATPase MutS